MMEAMWYTFVDRMSQLHGANSLCCFSLQWEFVGLHIADSKEKVERSYETKVLQVDKWLKGGEANWGPWLKNKIINSEVKM